MRGGTLKLPELDFSRVPAPEAWNVTYEVECMAPVLRQLDQAMEPLRRRDDATWLNTLVGEGASTPEHREGRAPGDLTAVVFLDTPGEGGELVVDGEEIRAERGRWVAFSSYLPHSVKPIGGGVRRSLAALYAEEVE